MKPVFTKILLFFLIIILKSVTVWSSNLEKIKKANLSITLSDIIFLDYEKNPVKILDEKTDFYILNFWASWCAPCIKEMKSLDNLKKKFSKVKVITLSQDADILDAKNFFKNDKYNNLEKYFDYDKSISQKFSLRGLPTTFIFKKNYEVFAKIEGIIEWESDEFVNWLSKN